MPTIRISVQVTVDDAPIVNFPFFFRSAPTTTQSVTTVQASGGGFVTIPSGDMTTIQQALFQSDQQLSVAFNGVTASPITLTAGGILCVLGGSLTALSASNASGSSANIKALLGGV